MKKRSIEGGGGGIGVTAQRDQLQGLSVTMSVRSLIRGAQFVFCFFCCSAGALACSRVARVSVCPQALLALREQSRAFGSETWHALLKRARWQGPEVDQEAPEEQQASPKVRPRTGI